MKTNRLFLSAVLAAALLADAIQISAPVHAQTTDPVLVGAGDIAICGNTRDEETAALLDSISGTVFTLGDNAYPDGTAAEFSGCYEPSWGRHKVRTRPAPGNHDYHVAGAAGYFGYFGSAASPIDGNCTSNCRGYYSYNLGAWHIIVINSEIDFKPGSAQDVWLRADLAANPTACTLAYWHEPLYSSAFHGDSSWVRPLWDVLYQYGADVVLNAHDHDYERFAPQNANGQADPRGIREFVAGTGGGVLYPVISRKPNSEAQNSNTWGVLKLTLHAFSYDWEFIPVAGQTFRDSGSANCLNPGGAPAPTPMPGSNVNITIGGALMGSHLIRPGASMRQTYPGVNSGPVKIESASRTAIIDSERVAYFDGSAWTSFSELMGLPSNRLSTSYVMPWYNNASLNTQLRFGNVGSAATNVTVTVGGVARGTYFLAPNQSARISYPGLDSGPVVISSSGGVPIIASERVAYFNGSAWTDFSELMGLPSSALTNTYWLPFYNNSELNTQLRFGNVGTKGTNVTVTVGGVVQGTYFLAPSQSTRVSYAGLNSGPVKISSSGSVPIIASERVAYFDGSAWTSFSELMGLPGRQLKTSYVMPWYNNSELNTQLRFGNVGTAPTVVTVSVGGVVRGNYYLVPNQSQRVSYAGLNNGPVKIESSGGVPIIASERVAYFNGSAWTSFSELMGLPSNQLYSSYVLPWYNNVELNTQLRFGMP